MLGSSRAPPPRAWDAAGYSPPTLQHAGVKEIPEGSPSEHLRRTATESTYGTANNTRETRGKEKISGIPPAPPDRGKGVAEVPGVTPPHPPVAPQTAQHAAEGPQRATTESKRKFKGDHNAHSKETPITAAEKMQKLIEASRAAIERSQRLRKRLAWKKGYRSSSEPSQLPDFFARSRPPASVGLASRRDTRNKTDRAATRLLSVPYSTHSRRHNFSRSH